MKKLYVNEEACIGCGACIAIDNTHFDFNEDGLSEVISNENIENDETKNAVASCPTNAISYIEDDKCECDNCSCENCECDNEECHCDNCNCDNCECSEDECHCEGCNDNNGNSCDCKHCDCE